MITYGGDPHGYIHHDDLAQQTRPFISPDMFEEFYEPVFKRLIDAIHELGRELHFHSRGKIAPLLPTLLDWGVAPATPSTKKPTWHVTDHGKLNHGPRY